MSKIEYDIALSFAGEDREYVDTVAYLLKKNDINVFYDKYEETELWGKDLYEHLSDVYKNKAKYTIIFISEYYAKKLWTNHERKSAQARAFNERHEYILPARFDDTEIVGIHETIGYIDLRYKNPNEFVSLIIQKLNTGTSLSQSNKKIRTYICTYCRTESTHGTRICLGCQAEIVYGSTFNERKEELSLGLSIALIQFFSLFIFLPELITRYIFGGAKILTSNTIILFIFLIMITTYIITKKIMKRNHLKRSKKPRFIKPMRT